MMSCPSCRTRSNASFRKGFGVVGTTTPLSRDLAVRTTAVPPALTKFRSSFSPSEVRAFLRMSNAQFPKSPDVTVHVGHGLCVCRLEHFVLDMAACIGLSSATLCRPARRNTSEVRRKHEGERISAAVRPRWCRVMVMTKKRHACNGLLTDLTLCTTFMSAAVIECTCHLCFTNSSCGDLICAEYHVNTHRGAFPIIQIHPCMAALLEQLDN